MTKSESVGAMTEIGRLVQAAREALDPPTHGELARRTGGLSRSRIQQLETEPINSMPSKETQLALARGLGVPLEAVTRALLADLGLPASAVDGDSRTPLTAEALIHQATDLSPKQRDALLAVLGVIREQDEQEEQEGGG